MATATDLFRDVLFNDGEGADELDFNNVRAYLGARIFDQILFDSGGHHISGSMDHAILSATQLGTPFLYALSGGGAFINVGPNPRETRVSRGMILQKIAERDGAAPQFIPFSFAGGDTPSLTHAVGDATNPRIDVIEVKLEFVDGDSETRVFQDDVTEIITTQSMNKKRRVRCTIQIKQGTPAASPAFPSLTAGFSALGAVRVPATYNAAFVAETHFRDTRLPLCVRTVEVYPGQYAMENSVAPWLFDRDVAAGGSGEFQQVAELPASSQGKLWIPVPLHRTQRLVAIQIHGRFEGSAIACGLINVGPAGGSGAVRANLSSLFSSSSSSIVKQISMTDLEAAWAALSGEAINAEFLGAGLWGNGEASGPTAGQTGSSAQRFVLQLDITTGGGHLSRVVLVRFFYAGGL